MMVLLILKNPADDIESRDDVTGIQRDLGQWDDGNEDAHHDRETFRVSRRLENVGSNSFANSVAKHEYTDDGKASIQHVLTINMSVVNSLGQFC